MILSSLLSRRHFQGWFKDTPTPEHLLGRYKRTGNNKYLSLLVEEFNLSLYHYLLSQSDKDLAQDIVQTVWLKVMKSEIDTSTSNVKSWLFTIARNTLIDEFRRQNRWNNVLLDETKVFSESLESSMQVNDRLSQFNAALAKLPYLQREAFIFQKEGFTLEEIAEVSQTSFETVKSRLRYARSNLRQLLAGTL